MNTTILIIICIGIIIHRHLSTFWETGKLPYDRGFILFVMIFNILYLLNFIWIFGFIIGLVLALLTFFQITFATLLWPFLVPSLILDKTKSDFEYMISKNEPSKIIYGGWSFLILGLLVLTIINFFISDYSSLTVEIIEKTNGDFQKIIIYALAIIIAGNLLRITFMKLFKI